MQANTNTAAPATSTVVATVPLAATPAKATVRTRRTNSALAKVRAGAIASKGSVAPGGSKGKGTAGGTKGSKGTYAVVPLPMAGNISPANVAKAMALHKQGTASKRAAGTLGCTTGQYAMRLYVGGVTPLGGTVPNHAYGSGKAGAPATPGALATYVARGRAAGLSWGNLAARTRTTEPTVRAAYQAATGQHHTTSGVGAWARSRNGA